MIEYGYFHPDCLDCKSGMRPCSWLEDPIREDEAEEKAYGHRWLPDNGILVKRTVSNWTPVGDDHHLSDNSKIMLEVMNAELNFPFDLNKSTPTASHDVDGLVSHWVYERLDDFRPALDLFIKRERQSRR